MKPAERTIAEACEYRHDRAPADQATGGVVHANGTHIVSQDAAFLAACVRCLLDGYGIPETKKRRRAA